MSHDFCKNSIFSEAKVYKTAIFVPDSVTVEIKDHCIYIQGVLGVLIHKLHRFVHVELDDFNHLKIYVKVNFINNKALIGTTKSLINGMIVGVTLGFMKKLQLVGIGYRASIKDNVISLIVGLSHTVEYILPSEVKAQCLNQTEIIVKGINKQIVGQVAADLRAIRPPEPFKGKGIRYFNEIIYSKGTKKR